MVLKCRRMGMRPQGKTKSSFEDCIQSVTEQSTQSSSYTRLRQAKTKRVFLSLFFLRQSILERDREHVH